MNSPSAFQKVDASSDATSCNRRELCWRVAVVGGLAAGFAHTPAPARAAATRAKLAPAEIGYQNAPHGGQRCELCANWQPPDACKLVAGPIAPSGWCGLFARRT